MSQQRMPLHPPQAAKRLIAYLAADHLQQEIVGDLDELFQKRLHRLGYRKAWWLYWLDVVGLLHPRLWRPRKPIATAQLKTSLPFNLYPSILNRAMLQNFLTLAGRQLWRNRLLTGLNMVGLAIGLSVCWITYRLVSYEFAFDQHHSNKERIYRLVTWFNEQGQQSGFAGVPQPLPTALSGKLPSLELIVPVQGLWINGLRAVHPGHKSDHYRDVRQVVATTTDYFKLVDYRWLAGSPAQALAEPNQVVLTQSRSQRYFPGLTTQQVLGQTLTYFDSVQVQVTGIVADPLEPSSFEGREFMSLLSLPQQAFRSGQWDDLNADHQLFVRLRANANPGAVEQQINQLVAVHSEAVRVKKGVQARRHLLQALTDIHFDTQIGDSRRRANRNVLNGLMGLAGFILLMAVINYVNLTTAQSPARAREIGIRKTLGSRRRTLIAQFLGETFLVTFIALFLALVLGKGFFIYFGDLLPSGTEAYLNWPLATAFVAVLVVGVSLLAGSYPGWLITRFQPVTILRTPINGVVLSTNRRLTLRKGLIVFQFVLAQVFIICAWLMGSQLRYALTKDMGFHRDAIISMYLPATSTNPVVDVRKRRSFQQQLGQLPGVALSSLGNPPANQSMRLDRMSLKKTSGEVSVELQYKYVDTNFVHLYRLPLIAGRNLRLSDTIRDYVLNETAVRALGFKRPQDAVGQSLYAGHQVYPIVGVVRDFQVNSVREPLRPVALVTYQHYANQINVQLASGRPTDWSRTLTKMARIWSGFYPDEPFVYQFYDQTLAAFYEMEQTLSRIINLATGVAILISCLGLFGLATLTAFQRRREIGVRKVLGASMASVVGLLTQDFLRLVLLALLVASPIAWWLMNEFLRQYAYRIAIEWWVFGLTGLLAVGIAFLTVGFQSVKAALMNPVKSLRSE